MMDRVVQAVYHLGVDPGVLAKSEKISYGFRKSISIQDAAMIIKNILDKVTHPH